MPSVNALIASPNQPALVSVYQSTRWTYLDKLRWIACGGTVGPAVEHREVKIIDEQGATVPIGDKGDIGIMDAEGYTQVVGRIKDMIIRGGENIYPREVEEFLYTHPDIKEVAVFGIPDEKYGEQVCAWIQPQDGAALTAEEVKAFCKGKISHFKIPHLIELVESYPMTVTGKIQKFKMRDVMVERRRTVNCVAV